MRAPMITIAAPVLSFDPLAVHRFRIVSAERVNEKKQSCPSRRISKKLLLKFSK